VDCQNSPSRLPKARAPTRGRNSEACPSSHLMTDGEWENFWAATDKDCWAAAELSAHVASADMDAEATVVSLLARGCGFKLTVSDTGKPSCTIGKQAYASRGRSSRSTRCGNCTACSAQDCGTCKNCLDKPRFGGPGIKKKACLARICHNVTPARSQYERSEDVNEMQGESEEDKEAADAASSSTEEEPALPNPNFLATIIEACKRQPLTPIRSRSCSQLDLLSHTALQTIPC